MFRKYILVGIIGYAIMAKKNRNGKGIKEVKSIFGTFIYENNGN